MVERVAGAMMLCYVVAVHCLAFLFFPQQNGCLGIDNGASLDRTSLSNLSTHTQREQKIEHRLPSIY